MSTVTIAQAVAIALMVLAALLMFVAARRRARSGQHRPAMLLLVTGSLFGLVAAINFALSFMYSRPE